MTIQIECGTDFEWAVKAFANRVKRCGIMEELRRRQFYEKPNQRRRRQKALNIKASLRRAVAVEKSREFFAGESRRMTQQFWAAKRKREESLIITKT